LSVRQPWAWLIVNGWKNIENRDRRFSHRGPMLIHAAQRMTPEDYEACRIFVDGIHEDLAIPTQEDLPRGGIVGEVVVLDCVDHHPSEWFTGRYGLVLDEACRCELIPWRGMPGLFEVPIEPLPDGGGWSVPLNRNPKPDCINNCKHHYIADHVKTFGGSVPVAGCRIGSLCVVGQDACTKYSPSNGVVGGGS